MNIPPQVKPAAWGFFVGAIGLAIVGFAFSGWVTGGAAAAMVKSGSDNAVLAALTPICIVQFNAAPDAAAKLVELKALGFGARAGFIADGGWATMPGSDTPTAGVDRACAAALLA